MKKYILIITLMALFLGCKPIKEVEYRDSIKVEYRDRVRVDSILSTIKDSVYINGDTVKIYRDRWRDRIHNSTDTIYKEVKVVEIVTKTIVEELSFWDWLKVMFVGAVIYAVISLIVKYWVKITTFFKF